MITEQQLLMLEKLKTTSYYHFEFNKYFEGTLGPRESFPLLLELLFNEHLSLNELKLIVKNPKNRQLAGFDNVYFSLLVLCNEYKNKNKGEELITSEVASKIFSAFDDIIIDKHPAMTPESHIYELRKITKKIIGGFLHWLVFDTKVSEKRELRLTACALPQVYKMLETMSLEYLQKHDKTVLKYLLYFLFRVHNPLPFPGKSKLDHDKMAVIDTIKKDTSKLPSSHVLVQLYNQFVANDDESYFYKSFETQEYKEYNIDNELEPTVAIIYSDGLPFAGMATFVNSLHRLGFTADLFEPNKLEKIKLKKVIHKKLLKENLNDDVSGLLYRVKTSRAFSCASAFDFYFNLVSYPLKDGRHITFIQNNPSTNTPTFGSGGFGALSVNYSRWQTDLKLQGYQPYTYLKPDEYDYYSDKEIRGEGYLRAKFDAYLHWEYDTFKIIEGNVEIDESDRKAYSKMGTTTPQLEDVVEEKLYYEDYERYYAMSPWSELRFVSQSAIENPELAVQSVIKKFKDCGFITKEFELLNQVPEKVTGYPYLIRSFELPNGEIACDVEIESEDIEQSKIQQVQEQQKGWLQQANISDKMTQCSELEATLTVYSPSNGNASYAYCDREYWDNDRLWGDVDGIEFDTGIRFDDSSLIIDVLVESEHKVKKENSLAKNLSKILAELNEEHGYTFEFKRPAKYYLSLDDLDEQYNWIDNPVDILK